MVDLDIDVDTDLTYTEWMDEVDNLILGQYGVSVYDGIDWNSRDTYDDGCTPRDAVEVWFDYQH